LGQKGDRNLEIGHISDIHIFLKMLMDRKLSKLGSILIPLLMLKILSNSRLTYNNARTIFSLFRSVASMTLAHTYNSFGLHFSARILEVPISL